MSNPTTVYLCGPISNSPDSGKGWRRDVRTEFGSEFKFHDPVERIDGNSEDIAVVPNTSERYRVMDDGNDYDRIVKDSEIINRDKYEIRDSDALLVRHEEVISRGTDMEIMYAHERDKEIALWSNQGINDLDVWLRFHVSFVSDDVRECLGYIQDNG